MDYNNFFGYPKPPIKDSRRKFTKSQEQKILENQKSLGRYVCARCGKVLDLRDVRFHHKKPHSEGGKTEVKNGEALCSKCHNLHHHEDTIKRLNKKTRENYRKAHNPLSPFSVNKKDFSIDVNLGI